MAPFSPFLRLHKYFESEWSYAHFRLPTPPSHLSLSNTQSITAPRDETIEEERCTVCWIEVPVEQDSTPGAVEHQLIALTYSGGWYRLALPTPSTHSQSRPSETPQASLTSSASTAVPGVSDSRRPVVPSSPSKPIPEQGQAHSRHSAYISPTSRDKGKGRETDRDKEEAKDGGRRCTLVEFRKFGRWDGW